MWCAQETAGFDPSPSDEARAKDKFNSCMDGCGKEFEGGLGTGGEQCQ